VMPDLPSLVDLAKVIGFPSLLFYLIYQFMKNDKSKWETTRVDQTAMWDKTREDQKNALLEILKQHKEERDRDFKHLESQTEFIYGQHQTLSLLVSKQDMMASNVQEVKKQMDMMTTNFRDVHHRFDTLPIVLYRKNVNDAHEKGEPLE